MRIKPENLQSIQHYATQGRIVVFDTETTGMTCNDEICQIAAIEYERGRERQSMAEYLMPACPMNPFAEQVHGISLAFLRQNGIPPAIGIERFLSFLGNDALLVAHNLRFDVRMLGNTCFKYGIEHDMADIETCDTLALARFARPGLGCYTLANLIETLGVDGINSHDALDDARACAGVFFKLIESLKNATHPPDFYPMSPGL